VLTILSESIFDLLLLHLILKRSLAELWEYFSVDFKT